MNLFRVNHLQMKKLTLSIVLIIYAFTHLVAQDSTLITGHVNSAATNKGIEYVNIGIRGKSFGTVSDNSGRFSLLMPVRFFKTDSLTFSCIGYKTKKLKISEMSVPEKSIVLLSPETIRLDEVNIKSKTLKSRTKGDVSRKNSIVLALSTSSMGHEIGTVIRLPDKQVYLKDFNFHIISIRPDSAKFRLNIYTYNKEIGKNILSGPIYFTVPKNASGDFTVDLTKYNLVVKNDIFVSVETVAVYTSKGPDPDKKFDQYYYDRISISGTVLGTPSFTRKVSLDNWEKLGYSFAPGFWMTVAY